MIAPVLIAIAVLLHAATAWRYGYFRDELYFIACSKHLAWGYVDQPPLVAVAAWLSSPAGYALVALRALPIVAAARPSISPSGWHANLAEDAFAQTLAGGATLLAPAYLLLGNTLTTTSFEPFFWTLAIFGAIRIVRAPAGEARRFWICIRADDRCGGVRKVLDSACRLQVSPPAYSQRASGERFARRRYCTRS